MKKNGIAIFALAASLVFSACSSGSAESAGSAETAHTDHEAHKEGATHNMNHAAAIEIKDDKLNAIYEQYILLAEALTDNDLSEAKVIANVISSGSESIQDGDVLTSAAARIRAAGSLEEGREAFSTLSDALIGMVKESGLKAGKIFVSFCPMARNNAGGYWLSNKEEIINPYYGEVMLNCGQVEDTII